jgi:hypothetical protein
LDLASIVQTDREKKLKGTKVAQVHGVDDAGKLFPAHYAAEKGFRGRPHPGRIDPQTAIQFPGRRQSGNLRRITSGMGFRATAT